MKKITRIRLGEVVDVASGQVDPTERPFCDMPHVGGDNIKSGTGELFGIRVALELGLISGKYAFDENDILYSKIRPNLNKVALPSFRGICSADIYPIRPRDGKVDRQYLAHVLRSAEFVSFTSKHSTRTNIPKINREALLSYEIALPLLPEQKRIAAILDKADAIRCKRQQSQDCATDLTLSLFYSMFGDPASNSKGFDVATIGDHTTTVTSGVTPTGGSTVYLTDGPYFIRSQNVLMNRLDLSDAACLPLDIHESMARTKVQIGDVLLNITGASIGRVAWVDSLDREANVNQHVCIIRLDREQFRPEYLSFCVSTPFGQNTINRTQSGASRQGLNHQQVRGLQIPKPPITLQTEFARRLAAIRKLESKLSDATKDDTALFSSLVQRAFRGEL